MSLRYIFSSGKGLNLALKFSTFSKPIQKMTLRHTILILFALFLGVETQAQTTGGNPQNTLLPEINPQDIEIRSEFRARFPGLRRQPILGFNPKPRVFRIDPNRMPFMESRDEAVANIAITQLDRPEPPQRSILRTPSRTTGLVKAGIGNFLTPELEGYFYHGVNDKSALSGNMNYRSTNGHLDNQESSFRYLDGDVQYNTKVNKKLNVSVGVGFLSDFNRMFNLDNTQQALIGEETAKKEYLGLGTDLRITKTENALEGWEFILNGDVFETEVLAGNSTLNGELKEQVLNADFSKYWAGNRLYETFRVNASVKAGNYSFTSSGGSQQWLDTRASVEYRKLLDFSTHITANAGLAYVSDGFSNRIYVTPEFKVRYNLKDAVVITGRAFGAPNIESALGHHQINRFLNHQTALQNSYTSGVFGEIAFQGIEGNRIFGGISYELTKDYAYYQRTNQNVGVVQTFSFYELNFAKATVFELFGGITQQLVPEKFWFDARFYARRPKLANAGDIPFEERLGVNGSLSYKPISKLKVTSWAEYIDKREAPSATDDLKAFVLLNAGAEYQINNRFGVYMKVLNILGQKYEIWEGYQERPLQAFAGLTLKF
ncbi:MAG: hypothetical protein BalsKO_30140 [Balneolaceae bacterium]